MFNLRFHKETKCSDNAKPVTLAAGGETREGQRNNINSTLHSTHNETKNRTGDSSLLTGGTKILLILYIDDLERARRHSSSTSECISPWPQPVMEVQVLGLLLDPRLQGKAHTKHLMAKMTT
jgi:hypothetical protein